MSRHEPLGGDPNEALPAQEGNRPAQNARLATPGTLSTQGYSGGEGAADFLGLDAEVGGAMGASELMAQAAPAVEETAPFQRQPSAWVETGGVSEDVESLPYEDASSPDPEAREQGDDVEFDASETDQDAQSPHASWSESAPARGGPGKLVGAAAGVLVLGLLGFAGMKFLGAASKDSTTGEPVASRTPPRAERRAALALPAEIEDATEDERTLPSPVSEVVEGTTADEPIDAEEVRKAFEAQRGDQPPAWFDPTLDSQGEAPKTGWTPEAEAVTRASTFIGDPVALGVAEASVEAVAAVVEASPPVEPAEAAPAEIATVPSNEQVEAAVRTTRVAVVAPGGDVEPSPAPLPVVVAAASSSSGDMGPSAPSTTVTDEPASAGALSAFHESRQSRTSTLKVEDVLLAPTMDGGNLRQADAKDLSGVWNETSVPMQAIGSKTKVLTPNVGRVRVVLTSKDIFEGRLYAVGQGSVWLESQYGRISVDGKRIASVANIDTKDGTPALGSTGSQNLSGLQKVLVKTPGGTFYGKVIARDDKQTTVITEKGDRLTMDNASVEILTDAPRVTIGGRVDEAPKKP